MKVKYFVQCDKHGERGDNKFRHEAKGVAVAEPKGKNQRKNMGCPICKKDGHQLQSGE